MRLDQAKGRSIQEYLETSSLYCIPGVSLVMTFSNA